VSKRTRRTKDRLRARAMIERRRYRKALTIFPPWVINRMSLAELIDAGRMAERRIELAAMMAGRGIPS